MNTNKYQFEAFISAYLPVFDTHFELETDLEKMVQTRKILERLFDEHGVKVLNPVGEMFDPSQMQVMNMMASDKPTGTILEVVQRGYSVHERLIRPPLVVIAK